MTTSGPEHARQAIETARLSTDAVDLSWLGREPGRDGWTMAEDSLRFISILISRLRPSWIVEFGSGISTRVLAAACAGLDEPARVVALESDPAFARRTSADLAADALDGVACVELTHLVVRRWYERNLPVYDLPAAVVDRPSPQLVVVDGPPLPLGGRKGSLLQALHLGEAGTVVLLDDADRPSEQEAVALLERILGDGIEVVHLDGFAKGLTAVVVRCPLAGSAMPDSPGVE